LVLRLDINHRLVVVLRVHGGRHFALV
jgi:hypothetical protein